MRSQQEINFEKLKSDIVASRKFLMEYFLSGGSVKSGDSEQDIKEKIKTAISNFNRLEDKFFAYKDKKFLSAGDADYIKETHAFRKDILEPSYNNFKARKLKNRDSALKTPRDDVVKAEITDYVRKLLQRDANANDDSLVTCRHFSKYSDFMKLELKRQKGVFSSSSQQPSTDSWTSYLPSFLGGASASSTAASSLSSAVSSSSSAAAGDGTRTESTVASTNNSETPSP